jgi:catechol 2,3-dioxygenase-like lactoylglutathione lyase family enzyme
LRIGFTVSDLDRSVRFFRDALDFVLVSEEDVHLSSSVSGAPKIESARRARLRLGDEEIDLVAFRPPGRRIPETSAANDLWFQHIAIVVSDMSAAEQRLRRHWVTAISRGGPQTLPASNPAAAGIRAFYFQDPEGHPLELIEYPEGKGKPRWHAHEPLFLGIDHSAVSVTDTARSLSFYEGLLGFAKVGGSFNEGPTQAALSGVDGARVEITSLAGRAGPGIELLRYVQPGPGRPAPSDSRLQDLWHWEITVAEVDPERIMSEGTLRGAGWTGQAVSGAPLLRDPDGHVIRVGPLEADRN